MKTVIAPVDFSNVTSRVVDAAVKLARVIRGRLVLLHVVPSPAAIRDLLPVVNDVNQRLHAAGNAADQKLAEMKNGLTGKFPIVEVLRLSGSPAACIAEQAHRLAADYIVIGSHGHTAAFDLLTGSVASGVLKKAPCPVLVIPAAREPSRVTGAPAREAVGV